MSSAAYSKKYNEGVEQKRNGNTGLFRDCGKAWILDNKLIPGKSDVNYGFYSKSAPDTSKGGEKLWQSVGTRHLNHQDYSQTVILMQTKCQVDGSDTDIVSVMKDPSLSYLINYDGVLNYTRQPGV